MYTLYKKELNYYLNNSIGYIVVVLFAIFANFLFVKDLFVIGTASMRTFFAFLPWLFLIFIPALSMRILSEEKRMNTIEVLLTLPVSETQIVVAKFLALLTVMSIGLALTISLSISLSFLSGLYLPETIVGYLGVMCMGASFIAISMFFSSQTKNQVVAFLISTIVLFLLIVLNTEFMSTVFPKFFLDYASLFSPSYHLQNFIKGVIDIRSIFYFVGLTGIFLFLTITDLEKRS